MNKFRTCFLLAIVAVLFCSPDRGYADVYASNVRITQDFSTAAFDGTFADGTGAAIRFTLNDNADSVWVAITPAAGGAAIKNIRKVGLTRGDNYVAWNGSKNDSSAAPAGAYRVSITAYSKGYASWTQFFDSGGISIFTRGVDSNRDTTSKDFGFMYAGNSGGPLGFGILRLAADGSPAGGDTLGGYIIRKTINGFTSNNMYHATLDDLGRVYVSGTGSTHDVVRMNKDNSLTRVITGFTTPRGLYIQGAGAQRKIYIADSTFVLRANIGDDSVFSGTLDTIANLGTFVKDVVLDDSSYMYVNLRSGSGVNGTSAGGISTEKYRITGTLPVARKDTLWSVKWTGSRPVGIAINRGANLASNTDDKLYVSVAEGTFGVFEISNISAATPTTTRIFNPPLGDISASADLTVDVRGNVLFFENNNEHVYFLSPPTGSNSFRYTAPDSLNVATGGVTRPFLSIAEARFDGNNDRKPDRQGDTVRVVGIVNSVNIQTTNFGYFIQDANAGIQVFRSGLTGAPAIAPGYRIMVTGKIDYFSGTTEITPPDLATNITILDTGNVVTAIPLTIGQYKANPEAYESRRIQLAVVQPLGFTAAQWPATGASANLNVWDGKDTLILRIDSDTQIDGSTFPTFPAKVTGVASQFTNIASADTGYQITPMFISDFVPVNTPPFNNFALLTPTNAGTVVLNDTAQIVTFSWRRAVDFNSTDTLIYQWNPVGFTSVSPGNGGRDTLVNRTGKQMLTYLGSQDSVVLKWTVATKDPVNAIVPNKDTSSVKIKRGTITGVAETPQALPAVFALEQNYPNPFNPSTVVRFSLPTQAFVTLKIYDILGREVSTLVNEERPAGFIDVTWNATNTFGLKVASGVYFYRMEAKPVAGGNTFVSMKKMMLLK